MGPPPRASTPVGRYAPSIPQALMARFTRLGELLRVRPSYASQGQRARIAIACASLWRLPQNRGVVPRRFMRGGSRHGVAASQTRCVARLKPTPDPSPASGAAHAAPVPPFTCALCRLVCRVFRVQVERRGERPRATSTFSQNTIPAAFGTFASSCARWCAARRQRMSWRVAAGSRRCDHGMGRGMGGGPIRTLNTIL